MISLAVIDVNKELAARGQNDTENMNTLELPSQIMEPEKGITVD